jgi:hypothetical protein
MARHRRAPRRGLRLFAAGAGAALLVAACTPPGEPSPPLPEEPPPAAQSAPAEQPAGNPEAGGQAGDEVRAVPAYVPPPPSVALDRTKPSPREDLPSALEDPRARALPRPLVDVADLEAGGPPPDGISSIDKPRFQRAGEVPGVRDNEPVLSLSIGGETRAYPVQIVIWHEVVNDTVDGVPVAVTYCPLCNSALAFDRRVRDRVLEFGVSGLLYRSNLVLYDRQTESLWPQLTGQAVAGHLAGARLRQYAVATVSYGEWRRAHPNGWVLSKDTGVIRQYGITPYEGYEDGDGSAAGPGTRGSADRRLPPMERVVAFGDRSDDPTAVVTAWLARQRVASVAVNGKPATMWFRPGTTSAVDEYFVTDSRDVGATGVFRPYVDGGRLHFTFVDGAFRDAETGSRWNLLGEAVAGPLSGHRLRRVPHVDTFWFAWVAYQPDTRVIGS